MREHALERTLKELNVFYSHKTEGCEWKGKLTELDKHVTESIVFARESAEGVPVY